MKHAVDAILRPEQADYLEALHGTSVRALAALAKAAPVHGRDPLLAKMEARAAERRYPISDPEVASSCRSSRASRSRSSSSSSGRTSATAPSCWRAPRARGRAS